MKDLIKSFGAFSLGPIVGAFVSFITVPMITYIISPEEYGKTSMFTVAQGMVSIFIYLGLDQAFVREFNVYKDRVDKLMTNALATPMITVVILDLILVLFADEVSVLLFDSPDETMAVYIMALMFPFMIMEHFSLLKIRMEEKGILYSIFTIILKVFILIFTVLLLFLYEKSFRSVVYAMAFGEIVCGIMLFFVTTRTVKFKVSYIDKALLKEMLKFGLPLVPALLLDWVFTSTDKVMLRTLTTYEELGLYTAAFKIVSILSIVKTCFTSCWVPIAYRWHESDADKKNFEMANKMVAAVMALMCMGLLLCKDIVALVLGGDFREAIYIFPFLLLNPIMYAMSESTCLGISFTRKTYFNIIVASISGGLNIILNLILIPVMGGAGAATATGLSYIAFFWARTLISRKLWWKFPLGGYIIYTVLITANCAAHTFMTDFVPYVLSAASIVAIGIMHTSEIKMGIAFVKDFLNSRKNK